MSYSADAAITIREFANCTVTARLTGVAVKDPFPGIFDKNVEVVSPFQAERSIPKPILTVLSADFAGIDSSHTLEVQGQEYTFDGKPRPDGEGLTVVYLAVKK